MFMVNETLLCRRNGRGFSGVARDYCCSVANCIVVPADESRLQRREILTKSYVRQVLNALPGNLGSGRMGTRGAGILLAVRAMGLDQPFSRSSSIRLRVTPQR